MFPILCLNGLLEDRAINPTITHIALHVSDIDACTNFYHKYCSMEVIHRRDAPTQTIVWMAEPGREKEFIFVIMDCGRDLQLPGNDYRHFGFAVGSRDAVDKLADKARLAGDLVWEPRDEPFPVGYYCGLRDPNGNYVEFSYGQPLGPGAPDMDHLIDKGRLGTEKE